MKLCLPDINVMVALLAGAHQQHSQARTWFANCRENEIGICRYVQLGIIRLLGNPEVMHENAISGFAAFRIVHELISLDERVEFAAEPARLDAVFPECLSGTTPAHKAVNDSFLAAFALASDRRLVTFDHAFRKFAALDLQLLSAK